MKLKLILSLFVLMAIIASCGQKDVKSYQVQNPFKEPVTGKAIILSRDAVEPLLQGDFADGYQILVSDVAGNVYPSQTDDINNDGNWDELVFLADFAPEQSLQFIFKAVANHEFPAFEKRTNIRFARKDAPHETAYSDLRLKSTDSPTISALYQMEGPGWENDIVGFRNYYDARNGMDIFGKRTSDMILDIAGINEQNYHVLDSWGMDILKVGNSLGAGAIAIGYGDEIYRIGLANEAGFTLLSEGPVRSVFDLYFYGVQAGDRTYDVIHRISIYAGDQFYRAQVWLNGLQGDEVLYSGVVDLHEILPFEFQTNNYHIVGSHGNQGFDNEILGLAIIIPESQFLHLKAAPKSGDGVVFTHLTAIKIDNNVPAEYAFYAGWELQDTGFKSENYFREMLSKATLKLDSNLW
jgi:hypothetical protein